jgi:hypothetical protein
MEVAQEETTSPKARAQTGSSMSGIYFLLILI